MLAINLRLLSLCQARKMMTDADNLFMSMVEYTPGWIDGALEAMLPLR